MRKSFQDRFSEKVSKRPTKKGCLVWLAGCNSTGYGQFSFHCKKEGAHRFAWQLVWGAIPPGYDILHRCDLPGCVNVLHLGLGTQKTNTNDAAKKGRMATGERHGSHTHPERCARGKRNGSHTHPERRAYGKRNGSYTKPERRPHGERHGCSKLNPAKVRQIISAYHRSHGSSLKELAKRYDVSFQLISMVVSRKIWKHVDIH